MHFRTQAAPCGPRVVRFLFWLRCCWPRWEPAWVLWPRAMRRDMPSAAAPQGTLRGCGRGVQRLGGVASAGGPEALDTLFADAAAYAQAHGLNALFLDVADAELSSNAFRDRAYETWPGTAADDSLFY